MSTVLTDDQAKHRISAHLKRLLALRKMTQADLAAATDESPMRISHYANAKYMPSVGVLSRIADALDASVDEFLGPIHGRGKNSA